MCTWYRCCGLPDDREARVLHRRARGELVDQSGEFGRGLARRAARGRRRRRGSGSRTPARRRSRRPAACSASMWKATRRPARAPSPTMRGGAVGSMSCSSSRLPSGNQRACPSMNVRGMSHGPRCEPATNSSVERRGTGSTGIQTLHVCGRRRCSTAGPGATASAGGCRLLDQHVVVVEPDRRGAHQAGGDAAAESRITCSYSAIPARCRSPRRSARGRPVGWRRSPAGSGRRGCVDPALDEGDLVGGEGAAHADGAVAPERLDLLVGDRHRTDASRYDPVRHGSPFAHVPRRLPGVRWRSSSSSRARRCGGSGRTPPRASNRSLHSGRSANGSRSRLSGSASTRCAPSCCGTGGVVVGGVALVLQRVDETPPAERRSAR